MDCNTCALHIHKYLEKKGMQAVKVNYATGHVSFENPGTQPEKVLATGIQDLGYEVVEFKREKIRNPLFKSHLQRFWFCFPFTALLMSHMLPGIHLHFLMTVLRHFHIDLLLEDLQFQRTGNGNTAGNRFQGWLDEVRVWKRVVPDAELIARFQYVPAAPRVERRELTAGKVLVELFDEGIPEANAWPVDQPASASLRGARAR